MNPRQAPPLWTIRLLLAGLFAFGSEIILWTDPLSHAPLDWLVRIIGYLLLATLVLDIAQRYRIRDGYDVMVLIAGSALLHSVLINPHISWAEIPASLLTRIIGADALVQIIMWGIFLAWLQGSKRKYALYQAVGAGWLGMYWGFWMRWTPELRGTFEALPLTQLALIVGIAFGVLLIIYYLVVGVIASDVKAPDLMLPPLGWGIAALVLILLFIYQAASGAIDSNVVVITVLLLTLCWLILWLRYNTHNTALMEAHLPLIRQNPLWMLLLAGAFGSAFYIAYHLPLIEDVPFVDQLWLMEIGSFAVGLLWLPVVATVIASRSIDRIMRQGDL